MARSRPYLQPPLPLLLGPRNGGIGAQIAIAGSLTYYAGGGAGGGETGQTGGTGGSGGGGQGGQGSGASPAATNGTANTGGGGGGAGDYGTSGTGTGGSGVVILRYPATFTITLGAGLTGSTTVVNPSLTFPNVTGDNVTTITAGSGNVSWT